MDDAISIQRLNQMHPKVRAKALADYRGANALLGKGVRLLVVYSGRTFAEQDALYAQGRTKPGKIVTNAKGGQSIHNYFLAWDFVILYDKNGDGNFEEASYDMKRDGDKNGKSDWWTVINYLISQGWKSGTQFKKLFDAPHVEYTFGHTWQTLLALHNAKKFIKGTTYVQI